MQAPYRRSYVLMVQGLFLVLAFYIDMKPGLQRLNVLKCQEQQWSQRLLLAKTVNAERRTNTLTMTGLVDGPTQALAGTGRKASIQDEMYDGSIFSKMAMHTYKEHLSLKAFEFLGEKSFRIEVEGEQQRAFSFLFSLLEEHHWGIADFNARTEQHGQLRLTINLVYVAKRNCDDALSKFQTNSTLFKQGTFCASSTQWPFLGTWERGAPRTFPLFSINQLTLVGQAQMDGRRMGVIMLPNGEVHEIELGSRIGTEQATVKSIETGQVSLELPDGTHQEFTLHGR